MSLACTNATLCIHPENHFPDSPGGHVNLKKFLRASSSLVTFIDSFGKLFAPIKMDMQGNINKIKKCYDCSDENACLLQEMAKETEQKKYFAAEGVLWLNRAIFFIELLFQEIIKHLHNSNEVAMPIVFDYAYDGSIKKYHSWMTQKLFSVVFKMSPTLPHFMKSLEIEDYQQLTSALTVYIAHLHPVRTAVDDFFVKHDLFP